MYGDEELTLEVEQYLLDLVEMIGPIEARTNKIFLVWIVISVVCTLLLVFTDLSDRRQRSVSKHRRKIDPSRFIISELPNWALLISLFMLFVILQSFLLDLMRMDLPISKDIESCLKEYLTSNSYERYIEVLTSILIETAIMSFTASLLAAHWMLFLARRITHPNLIKSLDYIYFSLGLLALYVNFSNILEEEVLFRRALAIDLAMTAVGLRIAKTTAEIRRWHR